MSHTEGKLSQDRYGNIKTESDDDFRLNGATLSSKDLAMANTRRLVACWNYCILIKTEDIESRIGPLLSRTINPLIKDIDERDATITKLEKDLDNVLQENAALKAEVERLRKWAETWKRYTGEEP
ncbi:MAG TPA: hypothetical protein VIQ51_06330, partial [Chryseosolibacter sp.]